MIITTLLFLILFAILFPKVLKFLLVLVLIGGIMLLGEVRAKEAGTLSCADIINNGWAQMPDVTDYVLAKPNSDKLGYGSQCHIESLVFAQCFIEPKWSVKKAVTVLIDKAVAGKTLPDTPACGA